jgi:hypothetical protein
MGKRPQGGDGVILARGREGKMGILGKREPGMPVRSSVNYGPVGKSKKKFWAEVKERGPYEQARIRH